MTTLRDDLLTGVAEIADYTGQPKRRILYLIEVHGLPVFRCGRVIHARKHQVDAYFGGAASTQPAAEQWGGQWRSARIRTQEVLS